MRISDWSSDVCSSDLRHNESMARHTSWRVGGPADCYFEPDTRESLSAFVRELSANEPILSAGLGSTLLVRDGRVRGAVIGLRGALDGPRQPQANTAETEAGSH